MDAMTWRERCVAARERGGFTAGDKYSATRSWLTCAVGEQHAALPLVVKMSGSQLGPRDPELVRLGSDTPGGFGGAVRDDRIDDAEDLLDAIEERVLQMKREATV